MLDSNLPSLGSRPPSSNREDASRTFTTCCPTDDFAMPLVEREPMTVVCALRDDDCIYLAADSAVGGLPMLIYQGAAAFERWTGKTAPIEVMFRAGERVTRLRIDAGYRLRAVDGLLTGVHVPGESHYDLLGAFLEPTLLRAATRAAEDAGYLSHEFGDSMLVLPRAPKHRHSSGHRFWREVRRRRQGAAVAGSPLAGADAGADAGSDSGGASLALAALTSLRAPASGRISTALSMGGTVRK